MQASTGSTAVLQHRLRAMARICWGAGTLAFIGWIITRGWPSGGWWLVAQLSLVGFVCFVRPDWAEPGSVRTVVFVAALLGAMVWSVGFLIALLTRGLA